MMSHDLARMLLDLPDMPVATHALNNDYFSAGDSRTHGALKIAVCRHYSGDHLLIGNISKRDINYPNWWIREMLHGEASNRWSVYRDGRWDFSESYSYPGETIARGEWADHVRHDRQHNRGWPTPRLEEDPRDQS